jgi:hypothetical protein
MFAKCAAMPHPIVPAPITQTLFPLIKRFSIAETSIIEFTQRIPTELVSELTGKTTEVIMGLAKYDIET